MQDETIPRTWVNHQKTIGGTACGERVRWLKLELGTSPAQLGQRLSVVYAVHHLDQRTSTGQVEAQWRENEGDSSFWRATIGPLRPGDRVSHFAALQSPAGVAASQPVTSPAGPTLFLVLIWHHHQPLYEDPQKVAGVAHLRAPWVRLHALRDYFSMAQLMRGYPYIRATINFSGVLLQQLSGYVEGTCTDTELELTRTPTSNLSSQQRDYIRAHFFKFDWHGPSCPYPRLAELLCKRDRAQAFTDDDYTDLRMWFNLAWFAPEFQTDSVAVSKDRTISVKDFVVKERGFSEADIHAMLDIQFELIQEITRLHQAMQDEGQLEVSISPYYHPILPLIHDSNEAILDRDGCTLPTQFSFAEDAQAQVAKAAELYKRCFGRPPSGMWPAEGAVGESVVQHFSSQGIEWIASDEGVLRLSGEWGYDVESPDILGRVWRVGAMNEAEQPAILFRDTELSNAISFHYNQLPPHEAARTFTSRLKERYLSPEGKDRVVTVILDGENAWGAYPSAGRPFLHALYKELNNDHDICMVTPRELLHGAQTRGVPAHANKDLWHVPNLAAASWIDESGSLPGNDLGTWIGEPEENAAWELLREVRLALALHERTPESHPEAFEALYAAEGSDWFWWYGDNNSCAEEELFDSLFREHLLAACRWADIDAPEALHIPITRPYKAWSITSPIEHIPHGYQLRIAHPEKGFVMWRPHRAKTMQLVELTQPGGTMHHRSGTLSEVYEANIPVEACRGKAIEFQIVAADAVLRKTGKDFLPNYLVYKVSIGKESNSYP